jgi:hypothetical protein
LWPGAGANVTRQSESHLQPAHNRSAFLRICALAWARGIGAYVIHASSVGVSRERRAKTDRLDTELLKRAFLRTPQRAGAGQPDSADGNRAVIFNRNGLNVAGRG